jgi:hypothetical protein
VYCRLTATVVAVFFVAAVIGNARNDALTPLTGLLQRISIITGWTWLIPLALRLLTASRAGESPDEPATARPAARK